MKSDKIRIYYNSNPNANTNMNHLGKLSQLLTQDYKDFDTLPEAIDFYMECTSPIAQLKDIAPNEKWINTFNRIKVDKNILEAEQFYWENREELLEEV